MTLEKTASLLNKLLEEKRLDTYAVLVKSRGEKRTLFSPNADADTYFDAASMGKVLVTAPLILRAVGEGKLRLNDTLDMFFDAVPAEKKRVTVKQLLAHTSGIVRIPIPTDVADQGREAVAAHILAAPLAYETGSEMRYSCNGYILLGYIAEKLFGLRLDEAYERLVKAPLGLTRSRFNIAVNEPNAAVCYERRDVGDWRVDDENVYNMRGVAGSGASFWTLADIERFVEAVERRDSRLYASTLFDLAETDCTPDFAEGRGLGWLVVDGRYPQTGRLFPAGSFGHCGHTGTSFFISREKALHAIILTNATRFANMRSGFNGYDYGEVCAMRAALHNAVADDLDAED